MVVHCYIGLPCFCVGVAVCISPSTKEPSPQKVMDFLFFTPAMYDPFLSSHSPLSAPHPFRFWSPHVRFSFSFVRSWFERRSLVFVEPPRATRGALMFVPVAPLLLLLPLSRDKDHRHDLPLRDFALRRVWCPPLSSFHVARLPAVFCAPGGDVLLSPFFLETDFCSACFPLVWKRTPLTLSSFFLNFFPF